MAVTILQSDKYLYAPFFIPQNLTVLIDMEAERPVDLYVLRNEQDFQDYRSGQKRFFPVSAGQIRFFGKLHLPSLAAGTSPTATLLGGPSSLSDLATALYGSAIAGSNGYLVIANRPGNGPVAVFYRVHNAQ